MPYRLTIWLLFTLFLLMNVVFMHRLPGLMGDEASEGENVYELRSSSDWVITGERSYIGPAIDYIRVPFMVVFGYTTLGVRVPMFLFSLATFWLAAYTLRRLLSEEAALLALSFLFFSPIWMTHQRLAWTITLFPFFTFLILALCIRNYRQSPLLAGLMGGLGLSNHIIFLPSLAGLIAALGLKGLFDWRRFLSFWPALIGFWAGFAMQLAVLFLWREDQGNIDAATSLVGGRFHDLPQAWSLFVSGSSYVAHYTGVEFTAGVVFTITTILSVLAVASLLRARKRPVILLMWVWMIVYVPVLMYMIDRFSLRYFVMGSLWLWMMAGVGLYELLAILQSWMLPKKLPLFPIVSIVVAVMLSVWVWFVLFIPYLRTGGSTHVFSLGNRTDSASALVDIRPLLDCVEGKGPLFSENVHIYNRLLYLSHSLPSLEVTREEDKKEAQFLIHYRLPTDMVTKTEVCPDLQHFRVVPI